MAASAVLHSLCLNVAHSCNLACAYCFAGGGYYGGDKAAVMSPAVAHRAVDLLLSSSPSGRTVSIDFFGGEPLLAWDTVVDTVDYASRQAAALGRVVHFTLTTNAVGLTATQARFAAAHMATIIVSLDGRREIHDQMRPRLDGSGSYEASLKGAELIKDSLGAARGHTRPTDRDGRGCPSGPPGPASWLPPALGAWHLHPQ